MFKNVRIGAAVIALVIAAGSATAGARVEEPPDGSGVEGLFAWATSDSPGCVVAVSKDGEIVLDRAYGMADLERDVPLEAGSVFDIGSVRKQFIAAAVLILAEEGRLSLSDDVRKYIPELPEYEHVVTLDHVLTHTSGIRDWTGLLPLTGGEAEVFSLILRQRGLNFAPGEAWSYSNSGYVLLKEVVVRVSGEAFADFARERLFAPLGMARTAYHEDLELIIEDRALAYDKTPAGWKQNMRVGNERGGGGALFSTARDLVIWMDGVAEGRLGAFVCGKLIEPARLNNGRVLTYARGVRVVRDDGIEMILHTGGAGGYSAWLGRASEHGLSVAVLCNTDAMGTSGIAARLVEHFLPREVLEAADAARARADAGVAVAAEEIERRAGLYFSERTGAALRLAARGGRLGVFGGPPLVAVNEGGERWRGVRSTLFFRSEDGFEIRFLRDGGFEICSMEGEVERFRRARPYAPSAEDLRAFVGRYSSEETGYDIEVLAGEGGGEIVMRLASLPTNAVPLGPVEPDTFQMRGVTVRFLRDDAGRIITLEYSNPVVQGIRYTRIAGGG